MRRDTPNPFSLSDVLPRHLAGRALAACAGRVLGLGELTRIHSVAHRGDRDHGRFSRDALAHMRVSALIPEGELERIPESGPLVIVANHPHGLLDGLLLMALVSRRRPDLKVLANPLLRRMPDLARVVLPLDPFGGKAAAAANRRSIRRAHRQLELGGCIAIFPAGEVAHDKGPSGRTIDGEWSRTAASLVKRSGASVVPLFIDGGNSRLFRWMGKVHPLLRTARLGREFVAMRNASVPVRFGHPIAAKRVERLGKDREVTDYLRMRCEILGRREGDRAEWTSIQDRLPRPHPLPPKRLAPLVSAVPTAELESEQAALPEASLLLKSGRFDVRVADAELIPGVLREIGRLRERTFREVGEGTGRSIDLDRYDYDYLHLWIWDREQQCIAGAYRLGETDKLVRKGGVDALYTASLFRYSPDFLAKMDNAVEMGRSFVVGEYQKNYLPLMLLWKGICAYLARSGKYRSLYGPVSISAEYSQLSRGLMLDHLKAWRFGEEFASEVSPRNPVPRLAEDQFGLKWTDVMLGDLEEVNRMVSEIEGDGKGVPVLMREYLKLGGRFLAFNRDPDFMDVVDGLVVVDLTQSDPRLLRRYFGAEALGHFLARHMPDGLA